MMLFIKNIFKKSEGYFLNVILKKKQEITGTCPRAKHKFSKLGENHFIAYKLSSFVSEFVAST